MLGPNRSKSPHVTGMPMFNRTAFNQKLTGFHPADIYMYNVFYPGDHKLLSLTDHNYIFDAKQTVERENHEPFCSFIEML